MANKTSSRRVTAWSALAFRDYRLIAVGQFVSLIGSSMQNAAVNWHIWDLTHDNFALGLVGLCRVIPIIVLALFGGVIADALDRRRLFAIAQALMLIFSGVLALATLTGFDREHIWIIYLSTALIAGTSVISNPALNALLPKLVPADRLASAISFNTITFQVGFVLGPVLAGQVIARFGSGNGPGIAYAFNAASFLAAIIAITLIHVSGKVEGQQKANADALREGLRFVRSTPLIWSTMLLDFFATFFSSAMALLPVYADQVLHVGADGYGILYAAPAVGAALGGIVMGQIGNVRRPGIVILISVMLYGVATIAFGLSATYIVALLSLAAVGCSDAISTVLRNLLRQLLTPDRLRGRSLSINMIFFMGGPQLGEFEAGALAAITSARFSVISGGIGAMIAVGIIALVVPRLRQFEWNPADIEPVR